MNPESNRSILTKATVLFVRVFGSWASIIIHTAAFIGWLYLGFGLEELLVFVSLEAIYIGIFILMAENIETKERERVQEMKRQNDLKVIKRDAHVDETTLKEIKSLRKQFQTLHAMVEEMHKKTEERD
jgi:uncharacterized membrane protein